MLFREKCIKNNKNHTWQWINVNTTQRCQSSEHISICSVCSIMCFTMREVCVSMCILAGYQLNGIETTSRRKTKQEKARSTRRTQLPQRLSIWPYSTSSGSSPHLCIWWCRSRSRAAQTCCWTGWGAGGTVLLGRHSCPDRWWLAYGRCRSNTCKRGEFCGC